MSSKPFTKRTAATFFLGTVISGSWYTATSALFAGQTGEVIPVVGAIILAGLTPFAANALQSSPERGTDSSDMEQRLRAFDSHAIVNIVDTGGMLEQVNDRFIELTGYTRDQLIGQPVSMLYQDEFRELLAEIRATLMAGKTWQGETPLRCADGRVIQTQCTVMPLFDKKGAWAGSISARTDVTHAKELLAERDTAETLYELRDDIWIVDAETERFSYMNRVAMSRSGWSTDTYTEQTLETLAEKSDNPALLDACRDLKKSGKAITQFDTQLFGNHFQVTIKLLPTGGAAGRFLVMLHDVSDIISEERMKSEFISMVSHELRSPLTSIKGSMGLLLSRAAGELPSKARALLEISHRNADRLVLIINDILDLEKIANGRLEFNLEEVDIAELLHETSAANASLEQRHGVRIQVEGTDDLNKVTTDPNRVIQVLTNFLSNASKFSKPGERVTIRAEENENELRISVADRGPGIPASEQHKVFQRFADLSNSNRADNGGTGLGLSVCKAIVENLGGKIGFDSREGFGTTFYFTLPKKNSQVAAEEPAALLREAS
ncbi:PAS domain-containing protein [Sulfitobacter sp. W002]|uniref:PAS domain-containing sensor histidine kinase n=1 Tax=Sulfitobacter sp. W002 TaxID=2867024 RepID=UPI0021A80C10|nr:ATP-binding protein [Sulfitobacter sp. W002]UWR29916.1 PAS domain-containing protein [Sulfitobacter sp. W002]